MSIACRLIIDEPADGAWNMAVDEALLESAADGGPATLRLYQWREPTLSLGYFQAYADRARHEPSGALPCVRRSSGGGALIHDRELTYSFVLPPEMLTGRETRSLYCEAHKAVVASLRDLGADASRLTLCQPSGEPPAEEPFLCFQRRADGDLLVEDPFPAALPVTPDGRHKVGGSAQRKRRGALLQHGGVLLGRSAAAPELPGLVESGVGEIDPVRLALTLAPKLLEALGLHASDGSLEAAESETAHRLVDEKHATAAWRERR